MTTQNLTSTWRKILNILIVIKSKIKIVSNYYSNNWSIVNVKLSQNITFFFFPKIKLLTKILFKFCGYMRV